MQPLAAQVDVLATASGFSGVVHVERAGETELACAYGYAHRALQVPNRVDTQFAVASGAKAFTAITVVSLIADGTLSSTTTARSLLGRDLPMIDDAVTIEHLLSHRSGIGDYLDENLGIDQDAYLMPVPVQLLAETEQYLSVLDGHPQKFPPGQRFAYCNGGYVVLALIAERATAVPFHDLVHQRVCRPAGLVDTAFLRSDDLPAGAALGYVVMDGAVRSNVFHLPVRGSGDGGIYTTAADVAALWRAFFAGKLVPEPWVEQMTTPRSTGSSGIRYGLGFWLAAESEGSAGKDQVMIQGADAGVSFCTWHHRREQLTYTVLSNTSGDTWPMMDLLREQFLQGIGKKSMSNSDT
jgi:CubicO group peptidase (beta-lactamase class C family)